MDAEVKRIRLLGYNYSLERVTYRESPPPPSSTIWLYGEGGWCWGLCASLRRALMSRLSLKMASSFTCSYSGTWEKLSLNHYENHKIYNSKWLNNRFFRLQIKCSLYIYPQSTHSLTHLRTHSMICPHNDLVSHLMLVPGFSACFKKGIFTSTFVILYVLYMLYCTSKRLSCTTSLLPRTLSLFLNKSLMDCLGLWVVSCHNWILCAQST